MIWPVVKSDNRLSRVFITLRTRLAAFEPDTAVIENLLCNCA